MKDRMSSKAALPPVEQANVLDRLVQPKPKVFVNSISGVRNDFGSLGHLPLFLSLPLRLGGFAPLRKSPTGKSGHYPLPDHVAVCHWP